MYGCGMWGCMCRGVVCVYARRGEGERHNIHFSNIQLISGIEMEKQRNMCNEYLYLSSETTLPSMSLASNSKMECAFLTWSSTSLVAGRISRPIDWSTCSHVNCVSLLSAPRQRTVEGGIYEERRERRGSG